MISLAALEEKFDPEQRPKEFDLSHAIPQSEDTGVKQFAENPFSAGKKRKQKKNKNHSFDSNGADEMEQEQTIKNDYNSNEETNDSANETENNSKPADLSRFD